MGPSNEKANSSFVWNEGGKEEFVALSEWDSRRPLEPTVFLLTLLSQIRKKNSGNVENVRKEPRDDTSCHVLNSPL